APPSNSSPHAASSLSEHHAIDRPLPVTAETFATVSAFAHFPTATPRPRSRARATVIRPFPAAPLGTGHRPPAHLPATEGDLRRRAGRVGRPAVRSEWPSGAQPTDGPGVHGLGAVVVPPGRRSARRPR